MENTTNFANCGINKFVDLSNDNSGMGWVVREKVMEDGTVRGFEFGIYIDAETFVSVPMHVSLKPMLVLFKENYNGYNYYTVPNDIQFTFTKYTNKKGTECPLLIPATEKNPSKLIIAYACNYDINKIANVTFDENTIVVRKHIDKERKSFVAIAFSTNPNPDAVISMNMKYGMFGGISYTEKTVNFYTTGSYSMESIEYNCDKGTRLDSEFIKLKQYIRHMKNSDNNSNNNNNYHNNNRNNYKKFNNNNNNNFKYNKKFNNSNNYKKKQYVNPETIIENANVTNE